MAKDYPIFKRGFTPSLISHISPVYYGGSKKSPYTSKEKQKKNNKAWLNPFSIRKLKKLLEEKNLRSASDSNHNTSSSSSRKKKSKSASSTKKKTNKRTIRSSPFTKKKTPRRSVKRASTIPCSKMHKDALIKACLNRKISVTYISDKDHKKHVKTKDELCKALQKVTNASPVAKKSKRSVRTALKRRIKFKTPKKTMKKKSMSKKKTKSLRRKKHTKSARSSGKRRFPRSKPK